MRLRMIRSVVVSCVALFACGGETTVGSPRPSEVTCSALGAAAYEQGAVVHDGRFSHLAIQGPGFFAVQGPDQLLYRRIGAFELDDQGIFVDPANGPLVALTEDGGATFARVGDAFDPPVPTTNVSLQLNLDADAPIETWDPAKPDLTSVLTALVTFIDAAGARVEAATRFTHTATGSWEYHVTVDGRDARDGAPGVEVEIATGTLTFDLDGNNLSAVGTSAYGSPRVERTQFLNFEFPNVTQFTATSAVSHTFVDGSEGGWLRSVDVGADGLIKNTYTNGLTHADRRVALVAFDAPQALVPQGEGRLRAPRAAGAVHVGVKAGVLVSGALEVWPVAGCE